MIKEETEITAIAYCDNCGDKINEYFENEMAHLLTLADANMSFHICSDCKQKIKRWVKKK